MLKVIDWTLKMCDLSLEKAIQTSRFEAIFLKELAISKIDSNSNMGIALNAGHLVMGSLLNRMPDEQAITVAKSVSCRVPHSPEERALVRFCGEAIVESAKQCLPEEVISLANQWKNSSVEEQIGIVRKLYFMFRSESQEARGELTMQTVIDKFWEKSWHDRLYDKGFLPGLYGKWDKDNCWANCQGKTQMLAAFANLADIPFLVVHPIIHAKDVMNEVREKARMMVLNDLRVRGLENACEQFAESLRASVYEDSLKENCFHVGIVLHLNDGSWILLDPHGLCWGKLSPTWRMHKIVSLLRKYQDILHGLSIVEHDKGEGKRLINENFLAAADIIHRSRVMEEKIKTNVQNVLDLVNLISESDDFDLLMNLHMNEKGAEQFDLSDPEFRKYAAMVIVMGTLNKAFDYCAVLDSNFLNSRIKVWLTFYHNVALNMFLNKETDEGRLVHPVCEFSASPEWSIATSALNSATFHLDCRKDEHDQFFVRNSFDQTTLFNAMRLNGSEIEISVHEALNSLPFLHPLCAQRINQIL